MTSTVAARRGSGNKDNNDRVSEALYLSLIPFSPSSSYSSSAPSPSSLLLPIDRNVVNVDGLARQEISSQQRDEARNFLDVLPKGRDDGRQFLRRLGISRIRCSRHPRCCRQRVRQQRPRPNQDHRLEDRKIWDAGGERILPRKPEVPFLLPILCRRCRIGCNTFLFLLLRYIVVFFIFDLCFGR